MSVTEFLLARIAEDESKAWDILGDLSVHIDETLTTPTRVIAECDAKRAQIEHLVGFMEGDYAPWNEDQLMIMAAVYSDHADYRPEWRVGV